MNITIKKARELGEQFKIDYSQTPFSEFLFGLKTELEHSNILHGDYNKLTKIVIAHLKENPRYYFYLKQAGL